MNKNEQNRVVAWRLKLLRQASDMPRSVAQTCRHFGLSRKTFYKWRARYKSHGEAGLCDRPRVPQHFPKATPRVVISKILYLRDRYHFGPGRTANYLKRFHHLAVARSTVHRILIRYGMNRLPANQKRRPTGRPWKRYEKPQPGHRVQVDVKFLERIAGSRKRLYQFTAIDDCTRIRVLKIYDACNQTGWTSTSSTSCWTKTASPTISICSMTSFANGRTTTITTGPTEPSMGRLPTSGSWQRKSLPACHRSPETLQANRWRARRDSNSRPLGS